MAASDPASSVQSRAVKHPSSSSLAELLRRWRNTRGMSQEELALAADTTCRYVSFIENGRAAPSRAMIERLATALELNTLQYNNLCEAAGYLPTLPLDAGPTDDEIGAHVRPALEHHMPNPAFAVEPDWTLIAANPAAGQLLRLGAYPGPDAPLAGLNLLDLTTRPDGLRPLIRNWPDWTWRGLQYLHKVWRRLEAPPAILETIREYPDVAALEPRMEPPERDSDTGELVIDHGGACWSYLHVHGRLATADHEIGLNTRLELLFPKWSAATEPTVPPADSR